jgi:hypothetical protein
MIAWQVFVILNKQSSKAVLKVFNHGVPSARSPQVQTMVSAFKQEIQQIQFFEM